jgi:hypothetical protein
MKKSSNKIPLPIGERKLSLLKIRAGKRMQFVDEGFS